MPYCALTLEVVQPTMMRLESDECSVQILAWPHKIFVLPHQLLLQYTVNVQAREPPTDELMGEVCIAVYTCIYISMYVSMC